MGAEMCIRDRSSCVGQDLLVDLPSLGVGGPHLMGCISHAGFGYVEKMLGADCLLSTELLGCHSWCVPVYCKKKKTVGVPTNICVLNTFKTADETQGERVRHSRRVQKTT